VSSGDYVTFLMSIQGYSDRVYSTVFIDPVTSAKSMKRMTRSTEAFLQIECSLHLLSQLSIVFAPTLRPPSANFAHVSAACITDDV
jgi:hypothetical protein